MFLPSRFQEFSIENLNVIRYFNFCPHSKQSQPWPFNNRITGLINKLNLGIKSRKLFLATSRFGDISRRVFYNAPNQSVSTRRITRPSKYRRLRAKPGATERQSVYPLKANRSPEPIVLFQFQTSHHFPLTDLVCQNGGFHHWFVRNGSLTKRRLPSVRRIVPKIRSNRLRFPFHRRGRGRCRQ